MQHPPTRRGLCSTCRKAPGCTFPVDPDTPVVQCEAFEAERLARRRRAPARGREPGAPADDPPAHPLGLCSICEERDTCQLSRADGPVWQCEEYR